MLHGKKKEPIGLVLEGGGAKGAYQIGAWKALRELGIEIDTVTGTSVGALNGALIAQGDFDLAYEIWQTMNPSTVVKGDPEVLERLFNYDIKAEDLQVLMKYLSRVVSHGGLDISPLRHLIERCIDEERVRASSIRLGIVTVSLTDFKPIEVFIEDIPEGKLHDYLIASANLPVFKLERMDEKWFVDGGFYDNLPIGLMASTGKKEILTVELRTLAIRRKVQDASLEIKRIRPNEDIGGILEFKNEVARNNLKLGYFDTLKLYKGLSGITYYVEDLMSDSDALKLWAKVTDETIESLAEHLGMNLTGSRQRYLFEEIIPRLAGMLELEEEHGYADILLGLYEALAKKQALEKFKIYRYKKFRHEVERKCLNFNMEGNKIISAQLPKLLKQSNLILKTFDDAIVDHLIQHLIYDFYYR